MAEGCQSRPTLQNPRDDRSVPVQMPRCRRSSEALPAVRKSHAVEIVDQTSAPRSSTIKIAHEVSHAVLSANSHVWPHRARSVGEGQLALPHWPRHTHQSPPGPRHTAPEAPSGRRGESISRPCRHLAQWREDVTAAPPRADAPGRLWTVSACGPQPRLVPPRPPYPDLPA